MRNADADYLSLSLSERQAFEGGPGLSLPGLNTLSAAQLSSAFEATVQAHGGQILRGPGAAFPDLEDGIPWTEVYFQGSGSTSQGQAFAQALASAMNIRVLFNRVECDSHGWTAIAALDLDPNYWSSDPVPAYSLTADAADFIADYGDPLMPAPTKASTPSLPKP